MNKGELRALYRQIRLRMSKSEVSTKSRIICRKLLTEIDWSRYKDISVFEPIDKLNEVDIRPLLSRLENQTVNFRIVGRNRNPRIPVHKFDLIILPCLAFDDDNYRLGWGGGFYDKFLAAQPQALKIGVCFQNGHTEKLPREPHDIALDKVMAEA
jgi:5-formyltetrahydrofolate cyclo-ligase